MRLTTPARAWLRWGPAAFFVIVLVRVVWLAWVASSRGVDFSDEGIYLVSYRYYRHPEMVYNGAPAVFGPLFHLVGYSVVWLRRWKLIVVLLSGLGLGWSTALHVGRRARLVPQLAELPARIAIVMFVAVGSFTMYTWLPQSPGYNDLSVSCAVLLAALVLPALQGRPRRRPALLTAAGAVLAVAIVNKWPAGFSMVVVVVAVLFLAHGWREAARCVVVVAAGLFLGCALLAIVSGRFFDRLSELRSTSEQLSTSLPVWRSYLLPYWRNVLAVAGLVGGKVWLVLVLGVGLAMTVARRRAMVAGTALAIGILLVLQASRHAGYFNGGDFNAPFAQVALPMVVVLAAVVWMSAHVANGDEATVAERADEAGDATPVRTGAAAITLLIGMSGAQAVGTLNPPLFVVVSSGALCASAIVIVLSRSVGIWCPALVPAAVLLVVFPIAVERMMLSGLWQHPYKLPTNLYAQTEELHDVIGYDGLSTDSGTAELLHNLSAIAERRHLVGRPGLSVSSSPGYALALGLTQPPADLFISSAEYVPDNAEIYQARLRTACRRDLISSSDPPVILTAGPNAPADITALLAACGIAFPAAFELELAESTSGSVGVWIPVAPS